MAYRIGDQLEIKIKKIVPNGLGMGFAEKLTVFVPLAVAGDTLAVEIRQVKGRTAFASILNVLEPGVARVEPPCKYFGECGGCDLQQMSYEAQLVVKSEIIRDCLTRIAHIEFNEDIPVIPSPEPFGYRIRTQFHYDARTKETGFFRRHSHTVVDIDECMVLTREMNGSLNGLRNAVKDIGYEGNILNIETAAVGEDTSVYCDSIMEPVRELSIGAGGENYLFDARSFFQANQFMLEKLIETAVGTEKGETAVELYCGSGLFSLPLARRFERVVAVESNTDSLNFLQRSMELARITNLEIFEGKVRQFLKARPDTRADLVLIDPPRSGIKGSLISQIASLCRSRIVYVSCNPSTLARDLAALLQSGFQIDSVTGLDVFPQTHHVETVVKLKRQNRPNRLQ